jgi:hypothetical protein
MSALVRIADIGQCPLYPQKQTLPQRKQMSALCQKQTFCAAADWALFDHYGTRGTSGIPPSEGTSQTTAANEITVRI